ncbi:MAG: hypothetical protein Q4F78_07180 [Bacillota bacterium]|nr:hypothetical protein [Bacillota bacterium]
MALPITKFLEDVREAVANFKAIHEAIFEYFTLKNKMLLTLSSNWTSGTKTVTDISKYETIEVFPYDTFGGIICRLEPDDYFRGSGFVQGVSTAFVHFEFSFTVSGDALTVKTCRYGGRSGTTIWTPETAFIKRIKGVEPKLPDALKNIIGGGYFLTILRRLLRGGVCYA